MPTVYVLLCAYGVSRFLQEQIDSILAQKGVLVRLTVSVDGASDEVLSQIAEMVRESDGDVTVLEGPNGGYVANFLKSIACLEIEKEDMISNVFLALADHDDVWLPHHLQQAVLKCQAKSGGGLPVCVGGRTQLVDELLSPIGLSPLFSKPTSFSNAIVQSMAGGNTFLLNRPAVELLQRIGYIDVAVHDWWIYQVVTAAGGRFIYQSEPTILYRQHGSNEIGMNQGWRARWLRIKWLFDGKFCAYNEKNLAALNEIREELTDSNQLLLDQFCELRRAGFWQRISMFRKLGIYRQTLLGNIGLYVAVLFKKM